MSGPTVIIVAFIAVFQFFGELDIGGFVQPRYAILEVGPWTIENHRDQGHTDAFPVADRDEKILAALSEHGTEGEGDPSIRYSTIACRPFAGPCACATVLAQGVCPSSVKITWWRSSMRGKGKSWTDADTA